MLAFVYTTRRVEIQSTKGRQRGAVGAVHACVAKFPETAER